MDISNKLSILGLSEIKVKETMKNEELTRTLISISDQATALEPINKSMGTLLYTVGTRLPKQFHDFIPLLIEYIMCGKINLESKLTAAIKFVQGHKSGTGLDIDTSKFEVACGVGAEVTEEEIENAVATVMQKHKDNIVKQRYRFNVGPLLGSVISDLKWAETKKVKVEMDLQILTLLGPKTEEDLITKSSKSKAGNKASNEQSNKVDSEKKKKSSSSADTNVTQERQQITMKEFLKTVDFHKTGDNYKTDGYVITSDSHDHLKDHLKLTGGQVRTRFPPEPNGILHIGHAKAININFGYSAAHDGICFLRYDDTNPEKEEAKFFDGILEMVRWLGYEPYKVTHSSDYFNTLYEWARLLVKKDLAYICHQRPEDLKGFNPPPSPWRNRPIEENLQLFEDMKNGKFDEGEATLRIKHTLEEGKVDPVAYRIKFVPHHRSGDEWCIYPTYDYTHCLCDSIEHITHSLCTKEFQTRRSSYYWLCNAVNIYCPVQWEYGRLNMFYTVVSKRKIAKLIEMNHVQGWDDPRLFTLSALRRRGFPAEAINNFVATLGLTGAQMTIHPEALEACVRDTLNVTAKRAMAVLDPLKVIITNFPGATEAKSITVPNIPGNDNAGQHTVFWESTLWIERSDFKIISEKGYRRLTPDQPVGLRHCGYILTLQEVIKTPAGDVDHLKVSCDLVTDSNKPKAFIHWVSRPIECQVRIYEKLFLHSCPEDSSVVPGGFLNDINPNSLSAVTAMADASVKGAKVYDNFQFERVGFFTVDEDTTNDLLIFNRTVNLKEDKGKNL